MSVKFYTHFIAQSEGAVEYNEYRGVVELLDRSSSVQGDRDIARMLALVGNVNSREIVRRMVWEYPSHDFHVDFEEAAEVGLPVERLPESQDIRLTEAIFALDKEDYHGFAPALTPPTAKPTKTVRKARPTNGRRSARHVNGSGAGRPEERIGA